MKICWWSWGTAWFLCYVMGSWGWASVEPSFGPFKEHHPRNFMTGHFNKAQGSKVGLHVYVEAYGRPGWEGLEHNLVLPKGWWVLAIRGEVQHTKFWDPEGGLTPYITCPPLLSQSMEGLKLGSGSRCMFEGSLCRAKVKVFLELSAWWIGNWEATTCQTSKSLLEMRELIMSFEALLKKEGISHPVYSLWF